MAKAKPKAAAKPIVDVTHPNDSLPAANSKSVIITSRPLMRDPMIAPPATSETAAASGAPAAKPGLASVSHERTIAPPSSSAAVTEAKPADDVTPPTDASPEPAVAPATEPAATNVTTEEADAENTDTTVNPDAVEAQEVDEDLERQAAIQKLVDSQAYFLPVNNLELKRTRLLTALGVIVILLLGVAWTDMALDAGLVKVANVPHSHFFTAAVPAPATAVTPAAFKQFTAPQSKISFKYPASWQLTDNTAAAKLDSFSLRPIKKDAATTVSAQFTAFDSQLAASADNIDSSRVKILDVSYQFFKVPNTPPYIQDIIYTDAAGHIGIASSVANDQTVKTGDSLANKYADFHLANSTKGYSFGVTAVHTAAGNTGFASLSTARAELRSATYQQGRRILATVTVPKQ
ncbi:MAG: hypothetical protein QFB87_02135 [Patescibacteria group bacterium]|nr:hypothetical protein [Patescibacteria group bacterium]